jgi:hypothetical protein
VTRRTGNGTGIGDARFGHRVATAVIVILLALLIGLVLLVVSVVAVDVAAGQPTG